MSTTTTEQAPAEGAAGDAGVDVDALYEAMVPRLVTARRRYLRTRLAVAAVLPVLFGAGLAWAGPGGKPDVSQLANGGETADPAPTPKPEPEPALEAGPAPVETDGKAGQGDGTELERVELGMAGAVWIARSADGLELGELDLAEGWTSERLAMGDRARMILLLINGDVRLTATIVADGDGLKVELSEVTPEPEPEVQRRKKIAVGDVAKVVVERSGDELVLAVAWTHEWWKAEVTVPSGQRVAAQFSNDGVTKHVEAWIDGRKIVHEVWATEAAVDQPAEKDEPTEEIQRRKEIAVGEVGRVVVERDGSKLWLGILWHHEWYDAVKVTEHGEKVHAYFSNDGVEHHVKAWINGTRIKHETWVVKPRVEAYDGAVSCGFGDVKVLVEGSEARVMKVHPAEGVEAEVLTEVGEVVRVRFVTETEVWVLEAWGNGHEVLSECGQVE